MQHLVIIGNGISGITTALKVRELTNFRITVISEETDYFFSRTALMYIYMGHLSVQDTFPYEPWFWEENRIELIRNRVSSIIPGEQLVNLDTGDVIRYDQLVIASGSRPRMGQWPGAHLKGVQGLYHMHDLQKLEENTHPWNASVHERKVKRAVIVGGGLIGVELAEMLISRGIDVTFLVRENRFWGSVLPVEEGEMIGRHLLAHGVDLRLKDELHEVCGSEKGFVTGAVTGHGEIIPCELVGVTIGVEPNVDFVRNSGIAIEKGILVDEYLRTDIPTIYAVGDCAELRNPPAGRRAIEPVWYSGRSMGETAGANIAGLHQRYDPGIWFNSAKFFDIEYQTYGQVPSTIPDSHDSLYWEHQNGRCAMRLVYRKHDRLFTGVNLLGIRWRHECCERWLRQQVSIDHVISHMSEANFDPEWFHKFEREITSAFLRKEEEV